MRCLIPSLLLAAAIAFILSKGMAPHPLDPAKSAGLVNRPLPRETFPITLGPETLLFAAFPASAPAGAELRGIGILVPAGGAMQRTDDSRACARFPPVEPATDSTELYPPAKGKLAQ